MDPYHIELYHMSHMIWTYITRNITYTQCTLKLRPVKLLFVIFGRLSYSFFVHLMVWGNGRLSYLILKKSHILHRKMTDL